MKEFIEEGQSKREWRGSHGIGFEAQLPQQPLAGFSRAQIHYGYTSEFKLTFLCSFNSLNNIANIFIKIQ